MRPPVSAAARPEISAAAALRLRAQPRPWSCAAELLLHGPARSHWPARAARASLGLPHSPHIDPRHAAERLRLLHTLTRKPPTPARAPTLVPSRYESLT